MTGNLARIDEAQLYPPLVGRVRAMLFELNGAGFRYVATSGFRSFAEQHKVWAQGRLTPGKKVTDALPGDSAHNFGLAVDFVRDGNPATAKVEPDWQGQNYGALGHAAMRHLLDWGGLWRKPDYAHVSWPGFVTSQDMAPLRIEFFRGGLAAVWATLDKKEAT